MDIITDHVVGQDRGQGRQTVFSQQGFEGAFGQGSEGLIRRCEYGEGTVRLQRFDQASSLHSGHQEVEGTGFDSRVDDVGLRRWRWRWWRGRR